GFATTIQAIGTQSGVAGERVLCTGQFKGAASSPYTFACPNTSGNIFTITRGMVQVAGLSWALPALPSPVDVPPGTTATFVYDVPHAAWVGAPSVGAALIESPPLTAVADPSTGIWTLGPATDSGEFYVFLNGAFPPNAVGASGTKILLTSGVILVWGPVSGAW